MGCAVFRFSFLSWRVRGPREAVRSPPSALETERFGPSVRPSVRPSVLAGAGPPRMSCIRTASS